MENSLWIIEFLDRMHHDATRRIDDLAFSAFRSLGYTAIWIFENRDRITIDRITGLPSYQGMIYKLDGKPLFQISQTTEIRTEGDTYRFLADWKVEFFTEKENK